jgi:hypothetical protein
MANTLSSPDVQVADLVDEFASLIAKAVANERRRTESRALVQQHSALRDIATLVAQDAGPETIFDAIVDGSVAAPRRQSASFDSFDSIRRLGCSLTFHVTHPMRFATSWEPARNSRLDESPLAGLVVRTGQPARIDDWSTVPGELAARYLQRWLWAGHGSPDHSRRGHLGRDHRVQRARRCHSDR